MHTNEPEGGASSRGALDSAVAFFVDQKVITFLLTGLIVLAGVMVAPFDLGGNVSRHRVAIDALPDLSENQQIVYVEWAGRSPRDMEDQVTYPLTNAMLGLQGVRTIRSFSEFGFSSLFLIFDEGVDFWDSRSRIIEKLASLPAGTLPPDVTPQLGPDATALGQVFWYHLEARDETGAPLAAFDLHELRALQDFQVAPALASVRGVSEVAGAGGHRMEYQIDVDPTALRAFELTFADVVRAAAGANREVGAQTTEIHGVEYLIRGTGWIRSIEDLEGSVVAVREGTPIVLRDVARVQLGPAERRGVLDRGGREVVGGVVVSRFGANPAEVLERVRERIAELEPSLPTRTLEDGRTATLHVVPFYDRSELIDRTLGTLEDALGQQVLITILVVIALLLSLRTSLLISSLLPFAVLGTFVLMKAVGMGADVLALAGIAIAIGTMVDLGIVISESIVQRVQATGAVRGPELRAAVIEGTREVGGAVITAVATTVLGFLPVFGLDGAEGRLFTPLAWTKTFALVVSLLGALFVLPAGAHLLMGWDGLRRRMRWVLAAALLVLAIALRDTLGGPVALAAGVVGATQLAAASLAPASRWQRAVEAVALVVGLGIVLVALADAWRPLGPGEGLLRNLAFVAGVSGGLLLFFRWFQTVYPTFLRQFQRHRLAFLTAPVLLVVVGLTAWLGFPRVFGWLPDSAHASRAGVAAHHVFPGLGREFMPRLDEGAFLHMPSTMAHASIGEVIEMVAELDRRIEAIPEVRWAVGKIGRAESPLDPAPLSMIETVIEYHSEFVEDDDGRVLTFAVDDTGAFRRDAAGELVPDARGRPFRQWRPEIRTSDDLWDAIAEAAEVPGLTAAPLLQPISARIVMLQSGIRANLALRLTGPSLEVLERVSLDVEAFLRDQPLVRPSTVNADRPVGKPYLLIEPRRDVLPRWGLTVDDVHRQVQAALGGVTATTTVEGRERYRVRVRYPRELRDTPEAIGNVWIDTPVSDVPVALREVAHVRYERGPQMIRSEDTRLTTYVMFEGAHGLSEVAIVEGLREALRVGLARGDLEIPPGVEWRFAGAWENAERARKRLGLLVPLVLVVVFGLLHLQFRSVLTALIVFSGIFVALAGGMLLVWAWGRPGFLDFDVFGVELRDVFHVVPVHLSVAVWVGFIALFGIATDDGVVMATHLHDRFRADPPATVEAIREAVVEAGERRIRPCLMTTGTTLLALLPVLTSTGTGADVLIPMAIPAVGGMAVELLTLFVVPILFGAVEEMRLRLRGGDANPPAAAQAPGGAVPPDESLSEGGAVPPDDSSSEGGMVPPQPPRSDGGAAARGTLSTGETT